MEEKFHLYLDLPPQNTINREILKEICEERLKVYKIITEASHRYNVYSKSYLDYVLQHVQDANLHTYLILWSDVTSELECVKDHVAHYMLRYVYCGSEADRQFFCKCESHLLQMRFNLFDSNQIRKFHMNHQETLMKNITRCDEPVQYDFCANETPIYCTKFQNIPKIVECRKCHIEKGTAFFSGRDFMLYLLPIFLKNLSASLYRSSQLLNNLPDNVLTLLQKLRIVRDFRVDLLKISGNVYEINDVSQISDYARLFFPLCMKNAHNHLMEHHHMKYHMKLQYCKFLKDIGIPFEVAMEYFKNEYLKKFSLQVFTKKHSYLFRHIYGKVGVNNSYKPSVCDNIINENLTPLQNHGCPYKHFDKIILEGVLRREGISEIDIKEIVNLSVEQKYQQACLTFYNKKYNDDSAMLPHNPQNYFCECVKNNRLAVDMEDMFL